MARSRPCTPSHHQHSDRRIPGRCLDTSRKPQECDRTEIAAHKPQTAAYRALRAPCDWVALNGASLGRRGNGLPACFFAH